MELASHFLTPLSRLKRKTRMPTAPGGDRQVQIARIEHFERCTSYSCLPLGIGVREVATCCRQLGASDFTSPYAGELAKGF